MNITTLQEKLYELLCMFDSICRKNEITYFLDSGCAIGAVREHDFIPWDDDVDVAILRSEYEKLRAVLKNELDQRYKLVEPADYSPYFYDFIPKLIDTTVPLRDETEEDRAYKNYQNRMAIDFIILDPVPDSKRRQSLIKFRCKYYYGLARSKRYVIHKEKLSFSERVLSGLCWIIGKFYSYEKLLKLYEKNTKKYAGTSSNTVIRSNSMMYFIGFFLKDDYDDVVYFPFHGGSFPMPKGYDRVLTQLYGDYMTPKKNYTGYFSHTEND